MSRHVTASDLTAAVAPHSFSLKGVLTSYAQMAKIRLSAMVVLTTAVGFIMASKFGIDWTKLLYTVIGTSLAACCANVFNQIIEIDRDARMPRTKNRPLPAGRISQPHAAAFAVLVGGFGITLLAATTNLFTAALGLLTILLYLCLYTPLKTRSTLNTVAGAVVGAIPPMMGWTAATGQLAPGAWVLGIILFVWQIPHFLALAWLYKEDYRLGGYRMLPIVDESGHITTKAMLFWTFALLPVGIIMQMVGESGWVMVAGSAILGLWFGRHVVIMRNNRDEAHARKVFLTSLVYLPALLFILLADRGAARIGINDAPNLHRIETRPAVVIQPGQTPTPLHNK